jgi:DNA-binding MarR family transcriptional regulator
MARRGQLGPEENTTALLGQANSRLGHRIVAGVIAAGYPQRAAHSAVFANIDMTGTRLTTLAARANVTPQAMGELVDDLQRLGYVQRTPDPTDGRAKLVTLTEKGQACMRAALDTIARIERDLEELLGRKALVDLRAALHRIIDDVEPAATEGRAKGGTEDR